MNCGRLNLSNSTKRASYTEELISEEHVPLLLCLTPATPVISGFAPNTSFLLMCTLASSKWLQVTGSLALVREIWVEFCLV